MTVRAADSDAAARLSAALAAGGVAVVPCDTIYGLVGRVPDSEPRIRALKARDEANPFLLLILDASWVSRLSETEPLPALARRWPGPLTIVLPARGGGTVALRVPDSLLLRDLMRSLDAPVYSTSVNISGSPALWRIADIRREFEALVDLVVDGGDLPARVASTIVDATRRPFRVLRQGAVSVPPEDLESPG